MPDVHAGRAQVFIVHHNPNNRRYRYSADPNDAVASAVALIDSGRGAWIAGNCHRMIRVGDLLLFKFGGNHLKQAPGIYAGARVTKAPTRNSRGAWRLQYAPDAKLTPQLVRRPIVGRELARIV